MTDVRRRVVIFSGTTEGRQLSGELNKRGIDHTVCVATEYGEMLQPKGEHILIEEGRKDEEGIRDVIRDAKVVVDATHPYAKLVTENIRKAAEDEGVKLLRVLRETEAGEVDLSGVAFFDTAEECRDALAKLEGNIMFTTGSKELGLLSEGIADKIRVYARVLPSEESLKLCEEAGLTKDHVIALQGPFSEELNAALLKQYNIDVLVTKESGKAGGFAEKIAACKKENVKVVCIRRPGGDFGISPEAALDEIVKKYGKKGSHCLTINIIGMGMGDRAGLTLEAGKALDRSKTVFGAKRLIGNISGKTAYPYYLSKDIIAEIEEHIDEVCPEAAVLFSGDTGFYSGASRFEREIREWASSREDVQVEVKRFPGVSSVSYLAARLGVSYNDAEIISLHGANSDFDVATAADRIRYSAKTFMLLSSGEDIGRVRDALLKADIDAVITVASDLSYESEKILVLAKDDDAKQFGKGLYVLLIENKDIQRKALIPYIEDDEFIRNKTPMTKALIRHECVRQLQLKEGDVLFDVGSGTGSVCIEAAGLSESLKVFSFEKKTEAVAVQKENLKKFKCDNIELIEGEAPETFARVSEAPDAVFIGGSTGRMKDMMDALMKYGKRIRVVVTAITMETMNEIIGLKDAPYVEGLEIQQITGSRAEQVGDYSLMKTDNAVMVAAFWLKGKE